VARLGTTSVRLSKRDEFYIKALIEQDYGETTTDILRQGLWMLVRKAQDENRLPRKPKRSASEIPDPEDDDPPEAA